MKKEAKVEYGITITKPWSREMYDHNEMVANAVCILLEQRWENALNAFEEEEELGEEFMSDTDWSGVATAEMKKIQRAITGYGFGFGYSVADVHHIIEGEIENGSSGHQKSLGKKEAQASKLGWLPYNNRCTQSVD